MAPEKHNAPLGGSRGGVYAELLIGLLWVKPLWRKGAFPIVPPTVPKSPVERVQPHPAHVRAGHLLVCIFFKRQKTFPCVSDRFSQNPRAHFGRPKARQIGFIMEHGDKVSPESDRYGRAWNTQKHEMRLYFKPRFLSRYTHLDPET